MSIKKKIIKVEVKINEIEHGKIERKINKTKSWFFEKTNKMD